ncbi:MAG: hypothetical protein EP329_24655 [Deltaproteobacteria bacterium]|nr:MAG: hypothetical protein EP329_24655 [Deltaproteobacteria bacterium]
MKMIFGRGVRLALAVGLAGTMALGACAEDESTAAADSIEVAGTWTTPFSDQGELISDTQWGTPDFMVDVVSFDNDANFAVTQNLADAEYAPSMFNKNVWTEPDATGFYYCTVAFGLDTAEAAAAADASVADTNDLDAGCGGFGWTHLTR